MYAEIGPATVKNVILDSGKSAISAHASYQTMHQFRLQAKRFRYTLELFEPFYAGEMSRAVEILKELQDLLGEVNDCATMFQPFQTPKPIKPSTPTITAPTSVHPKARIHLRYGGRIGIVMLFFNDAIPSSVS